MTINAATPKDWDRVRKAHPAIERDNITVQPDITPVNLVDRPPHYNHGTIECIDYLEDTLGDGFTSYLEGSIKKYLHRFRYKNADDPELQVQDLQKAQWYLTRLITTLSKT